MKTSNIPRSKKERTREFILDTAYVLFAKDGFHKITMKDICEATGLSRGGLYSHFPGTKEIFEAILVKINQKDEMNFEKEMKEGVPAQDILNRALELMEYEMGHSEDSLSLAMYEYAAIQFNLEITYEPVRIYLDGLILLGKCNRFIFL